MESISLGMEILRALKKNFFNTLLIDCGISGEPRFKKGTILTLALLLSKKYKEEIVEKRVGVVLPPGIGSVLANLALIFAGKVPVNLNFSLGSSTIKYSMQKAEISSLISARKMVEKFPHFPWGNQLIDISGWLREIKQSKIKLALLHIIFFLFPAVLLKRLINNDICNKKEAALLFTSGSSGNPKGVVLTDKNIVSNCNQINAMNLLDKGSVILSNLPLFHSFGFTISTIYPLLADLVIVSLPSPLDAKSCIKAIESHKIEIILGTPTFLRGYLVKAKPEQLKSVCYVIAGAEKTPEELKIKWESLCSCQYLEGYGLTEASPAISFNQPGTGSRDKSVGKLLDGIQCKTICPDSGKELDSGDLGLLCFKGPNIFNGYLKEEEATQAAFDHQGWFITGDLGKIDQDGFLFIEGRLSRFSKIGGEMVPHEKVETEITQVLSGSIPDKPICAIYGQADEKKGEKLVLLTTRDITTSKLRSLLSERGLPNLWIPREIKIVDEIPILASGKLDLQAIKQICLSLEG